MQCLDVKIVGRTVNHNIWPTLNLYRPSFCVFWFLPSIIFAEIVLSKNGECENTSRPKTYWWHSWIVVVQVQLMQDKCECSMWKLAQYSCSTLQRSTTTNGNYKIPSRADWFIMIVNSLNLLYYAYKMSQNYILEISSEQPICILWNWYWYFVDTCQLITYILLVYSIHPNSSNQTIFYWAIFNGRFVDIEKSLPLWTNTPLICHDKFGTFALACCSWCSYQSCMDRFLTIQ